MGEPVYCDADRLVALVRDGDIQALDALSRCYGERMLAVGRRRCRDESQAQDAVQDAYVAAGRNLQQFRGEGSLEGWLVRMVANACTRMRRGRKNDPNRHVAVDPTLPDDDDAPDEAVARGEVMAAIGEALLALAPRDRTLVLLADAQGWTAPEIAKATELTPGAVRTRLSRARRRLRGELEPLRGLVDPTILENS